MNTKLISEQAFAVIEQYKNVPYFNNKTTGRRAALRVEIGKGSPKEIYNEVKERALIDRIDIKNFTNIDLKKFMVEKRIGIECSGFAYHVLSQESISRGKGSLDRHLHFPYSKGIIGKIRSKLRPIENTDAKTFGHDKNSRVIAIKDAQVGDIVTMLGNAGEGERDHIVVINQIEYQNSLPITLHYVHAIAWPTDGEFGTGIHEGVIEITDLNKSLVEQRWIELEKMGEENYTHTRAKKSSTELRRLTWFN